MTEFIVSEVIDGEPLRLRKPENGAREVEIPSVLLDIILQKGRVRVAKFGADYRHNH